MNPKNLNILLGVAVVVLLGVVGYLVFVNKSQEQTLGQQNNDTNAMPVNNVAQPTNNNAVPNSNSNSSTATWRTYTDTQNGFEFMFPASFKQTNFPQYPVFSDDMENSISVEVVAKKFDPNKIEGLYGPIENPEKVQIGTKTGYKYLEGDAGCGGSTVVTAIGNSTLKVTFGACETGVNTNDFKPLYNNQELIAQILATFKFTK